MKYLLMIALVAVPSRFNWGVEPHYVDNPNFFFFGATSSTSLGPSAPGFDTCGSAFGQEFTAPAEQAHYGVPLLPCWDGATDLLLLIFITNEEGDVPADGETIIFNFAYRAANPTESASAGLLVTVQATYTQSGAGTDCLLLAMTPVPLDRGNGDQPYTYGDTIAGVLSIDAASTYSGNPIVGNVAFLIPNNKTCHAG